MQVLQWRLSSGAGERLVHGEVRTVAIVLASAPTSATVRVVQLSTPEVELVASAAASVNGSVVSTVLTVPDVTDRIMVEFLCVVGGETVGVGVEIAVAAS